MRAGGGFLPTPRLHCLPSPPVSQRVHLDIQVGEHANNYAEIAAKDKLTELQLRVRQLVEQVDQIQKEQNYQRVSLRLGPPRHRARERPRVLTASSGLSSP